MAITNNWIGLLENPAIMVYMDVPVYQNPDDPSEYGYTFQHGSRKAFDSLQACLDAIEAEVTSYRQIFN